MQIAWCNLAERARADERSRQKNINRQEEFANELITKQNLTTIYSSNRTFLHLLQVLLSRFVKFTNEITQKRHWIGIPAAKAHGKTDPDSFRIGGLYVKETEFGNV